MIKISFVCLLFLCVMNSHAEEISIKAEVWVDNWFSFYSGDSFIFKDSVAITTERSFNSEKFTFDAKFPLVLNFVLKDFKENDTGLEYIGSRKQQLGDGGFIAQFTDANSGNVVAVTNRDWHCSVIHNAPLDKSCKNESDPVAGKSPCNFISKEEPDNWKSNDFDDSKWANATEFSAVDIRPKDGFDKVTWYSAAKFIWSDDLEAHNTVLCRLVIQSLDEIKPISKDKASFEKMDRHEEKRFDKQPLSPRDGSRPPPPPRR